MQDHPADLCPHHKEEEEALADVSLFGATDPTARRAAAAALFTKADDNEWLNTARVRGPRCCLYTELKKFVMGLHHNIAS